MPLRGSRSHAGAQTTLRVITHQAGNHSGKQSDSRTSKHRVREHRLKPYPTGTKQDHNVLGVIEKFDHVLPPSLEKDARIRTSDAGTGGGVFRSQRFSVLERTDISNLVLSIEALAYCVAQAFWSIWIMGLTRSPHDAVQAPPFPM